ncbi:phosphate ABC transporter ATP-binding protein [Halobacteriales archaeon QH_7_69_31]|nr:MAG: phosphate ABC transporter ATP-binding protein [Halobacteriales archaeon QH_7_69_31]
MQRAVRDRRGDATDGLTLSAATHGFGAGPVLEDVTLSVRPGETLAVIGPSGTGKTTLLRLLAMFDRPDEGQLRLDGTDVWTRDERGRLAARRRVGMVFQEANLFGASVRRNVSYGLRVRRDWPTRLRAWLRRKTGAPAPISVTDHLSVVGLADAADRNATDLSGGEAQRVAFARALAYDPDFLLLDEPTSDLDPRNTAVLEEAIDTAAARGIGVVVATHDMDQAERVADRVAVVLGGRLIEVGATERVFGDPEDPAARRFIRGELVY